MLSSTSLLLDVPLVFATLCSTLLALYRQLFADSTFQEYVTLSSWIVVIYIWCVAFCEIVWWGKQFRLLTSDNQRSYSYDLFENSLLQNTLLETHTIPSPRRKFKKASMPVNDPIRELPDCWYLYMLVHLSVRLIHAATPNSWISAHILD